MKTRPFYLGALLAATPVSPLVAQAAPAIPGATADSITQAALGGLIAGLSIGVVRGHDTLLLKGYGFADLENEVPATPRTIYRIGSLTKQFTALAIMRLAEQGKIHLEDEITTYLPDFSTQKHRVTVRHLLTHTSGIKSYTVFGDARLSRLDLTRNEVVALFEDEPFDFDPGEDYAYSNSGYFLLGMIIERVSGQEYADYLQANIFEPLGLQDTKYCDNRRIIKRRAEGYSVAGARLVNDEPVSMTQPFAAGGLCSSVADLLTWQASLSKQELISLESYRSMVTPATLTDGSRPSYGFGVGITQIDGHLMIAHGGGINGFNSYMAHLPDDSLTVVVLVNTEGSEPWSIARDVIRSILGTTPAAVVEHALSNSERERYVGYYDLPDLQLRIFERDGGLMAQATGQPAFALIHQGAHEFIAGFDHSVRIEFQVRGNLSVGLMLEQGGQRVRGVRILER
jgi:CubicO group peptidase (beta-lactamase class C family)